MGKLIGKKIKAGEMLIRENCRRTHGLEAAFDVAATRLKDRYMAAMKHDCNKAADFRIVMTLERD